MINIIVTAIILVAAGGAIAYIIKEKKKGVRCIGCPAAEICSGRSCSQISEAEIEEITNNIKN